MAQPINDIIFCNEERCASDCGDALGLCENGIAVADPVAAAVANVVYTTDNGTTWTNAAAAPFVADEAILSATCFRKSRDVTRWIVAREGSGTDNAEIAYSDDSGANWTNVDVEASGAGVGTADSGALFALDNKHVWLVLSDGIIVFSKDGGVSWTIQDNAVLTAGDYHAVHFANKNSGYAVAASGIVVKTDNGGDTWFACTAISGTPDVLSVYCFNDDDVVVGDDNGVLWKSNDGGTTWTALFTGATAINDVMFTNEISGILVDGTTAYRTRNGGEDWEEISNLPTVTEFNSVWACDLNNFYIAGEDDSNLGIVLEIA